MCALPLADFPTGIMRARFHPLDGQLYTCGMYAWAGSRTQPGGFYRVRYTGKPVDLPIGLNAISSGMEIKFTDALDANNASDTKNYEVRIWDLKRSKEYGSKHLNEQSLPVTKARLRPDGKTIKLEIANLKPTWGMEIKYRLKGADGRAIVGTIHNTIHQFSDIAGVER
jgi:hypothetical protein